MAKRLLTTMVLALMMALTAVAQNDSIFLIKGDKVIGKYSTSEVDYLSFAKPDGVTEEPVSVTVNEAGKNYIYYNVNTINPSTGYVHCVVLATTVDYILQEYCGSSLATATEDDMAAAINMCMYNFGYEGTGTDTYEMRDGENSFMILGGQEYYICAWPTDDSHQLTGHPVYTTVTTKPAGVSKEKLTVAYNGLDDKGNATFKFEAGSNIRYIYTAYGYKSMMEQYMQIYGYEFLMFNFGNVDYPDNLTGSNAAWPVQEENDYKMYVLGIDVNGDWVKAETEAHITPSTPVDYGPRINLLDKSKGEGSVSVKFEITPSNVDEAYVRVIDENTADDRINMGYTPAELAAGGDATDVTREINNLGEYTYTASDLPDKWLSMFIMGRNADGTAVTRINFHPYLDESQWDIIESITGSGTRAPEKTLAKPATVVVNPTMDKK